MFLYYKAEHLDTVLESVQPGQAGYSGPAQFMVESLAALPLQAALTSVPALSLSHHSLLSLALQRRGDTFAWGMETWACPHH